MNRLVLIGNGFDLAHGLKTRYSDFMLDLIKRTLYHAEFNYLVKGKQGQRHEHTVTHKDYLLFGIQIFDRASFFYVKQEVYKIDSFDALTAFFEQHGLTLSFPEVITSKTPSGKEFSYTSILKTMIDALMTRNLKWVDVEGAYYQSLLTILNQFDKHGNRVYDENSKAEIGILNTELDYLKIQLEMYLSAIMPKHIPDNLGVRGINFWSKIKGEFSTSEQGRLSLTEEQKFPKQVHILNFNYTPTFTYYGSHCACPDNLDVQVAINHIHGELNKLHNPLIFGYGDETDEHYSVMEKLNDNTLFQHIKSFGYFKTDNYHQLLRFLDSDQYQVYIIGHSCGLSDRVMLKHIFEHKKCKSIQIFYHQRKDGSDDYIEKTQEISRHFEDKRAMREKMVPKPNCHPISGLNLAWDDIV